MWAPTDDDNELMFISATIVLLSISSRFLLFLALHSTLSSIPSHFPSLSGTFSCTGISIHLFEGTAVHSSPNHPILPMTLLAHLPSSLLVIYFLFSVWIQKKDCSTFCLRGEKRKVFLATDTYT
ncbi:MAG: hypothetical protein J3R72DRAFT_458099 [Linnemannia gamsii]|nr:MAG: hypothetical protein J3R72DRAFT_458099 [Linnemannia gamsii]